MGIAHNCPNTAEIGLVEGRSASCLRSPLLGPLRVFDVMFATQGVASWSVGFAPRATARAETIVAISSTGRKGGALSACWALLEQCRLLSCLACRIDEA